MKRAKRILVSLLTLALALSLCAGLAACGNRHSDSMDADTDRAPVPEDSYTMPNGNGISSEPDPIQEPAPIPKVLPEVVTNFDTVSSQVDSDNGYDFYYVTDKGLALLNPATGEEIIVMERTGSSSTVYHMNFLALTGQRGTYMTRTATSILIVKKAKIQPARIITLDGLAARGFTTRLTPLILNIFGAAAAMRSEGQKRLRCGLLS